MPKICQPRGKLLSRLNQLREGRGGTVGWSETHQEERRMRVVRQQWIWIQVSMEKLLVIDGHKRCVTFSLSYVMTYHQFISSMQNRFNFGKGVLSIFLTKIMAAIIDFNSSGRLGREINLYQGGGGRGGNNTAFHSPAHAPTIHSDSKSNMVSLINNHELIDCQLTPIRLLHRRLVDI